MRVADVEITKEIGIVHFDKLEVHPVTSKGMNNTLLMVEAFNRTVSHKFERNSNEIKNELDLIHTRHTSFLWTYSFEKWMIVGTIVLLSLLAALYRVVIEVKKCKSATRNNDIELERPKRGVSFMQSKQNVNDEIELGYQVKTNDQQQQQQQHQQQQDDFNVQRADETKFARNDNMTKKRSSNVYSEIADPNNLSFSSKPEQSQFFK